MGGAAGLPLGAAAPTYRQVGTGQREGGRDAGVKGGWVVWRGVLVLT